MPAAEIQPMESLARAIQLSVTPVFLLASISGLLGVLTTRMGRVVDRVRELKRQGSAGDLAEDRQVRQRRMALSSRAVGCAAASFLLVSTMVVALFISTVARFNLTAVLVPLFVLAMLLLMAAVLLLLREIQLGRRLLEFY
jgi:cobalamin biosynthesis protein CobD/CbiB